MLLHFLLVASEAKDKHGNTEKIYKWSQSLSKGITWIVLNSMLLFCPYWSSELSLYAQHEDLAPVAHLRFPIIIKTVQYNDKIFSIPPYLQ